MKAKEYASQQYIQNYLTSKFNTSRPCVSWSVDQPELLDKNFENVFEQYNKK
jgi:hypothetical protein